MPEQELQTSPKECDDCKEIVTRWWYIVMTHRPTGTSVMKYVCENCVQTTVLNKGSYGIREGTATNVSDNSGSATTNQS